MSLTNTELLLKSIGDELEILNANITTGGATPTLQQVSDVGGLDNGSTLRQGSKDNYGYGGGISQVCVDEKELQWENGVLYYFEVGSNITYASSINNDAPDNTYDDTKSWDVGSRFTMLTTGDTYVCTDNTTDNAIWELEVVDIVLNDGQGTTWNDSNKSFDLGGIVNNGVAISQSTGKFLWQFDNQTGFGLQLTEHITAVTRGTATSVVALAADELGNGDTYAQIRSQVFSNSVVQNFDSDKNGSNPSIISQVGNGTNTAITYLRNNRFIIDTVSGLGALYQDDYSAINASNPRWIPDKQYVDNNVLSASREETHTSGSTVTISDNISILYVDPASLIVSLTITLPAAPVNGQEVKISFGGTITAGVVVTSMTVSGNIGHTVLGTATTSANVGDGYIFKFQSALNLWRIF